MRKKGSDLTQDKSNLNNDLQERAKTMSSQNEDLENLTADLKNSDTTFADLEMEVRRKKQDLHEHDDQERIELASQTSTVTQLEGQLEAALQHLQNLIVDPGLSHDSAKLRDMTTTLPSTNFQDHFTEHHHSDPQDISTEWSLSMASENELLPFIHQPFTQLTTRVYLSVSVHDNDRAIQSMLEVMLQKPEQCDTRHLPLLVSLVHNLLQGTVTEATAMFTVRVMELIIRVAKAHNYAWYSFHSLWQSWKPMVRPATRWAQYMLIRAHVSWLDLWAEAVNVNATSSVVPLSQIWMSNSRIAAIDNDTLTYAMPELSSVEEEVPEDSFRSPRTLFANRIDSSAKIYAIVDVQARWIVVYPDSEGELRGKAILLPQRCKLHGEFRDVPDFELPIDNSMFVVRNMNVVSVRSFLALRARHVAERQRLQGMQ